MVVYLYKSVTRIDLTLGPPPSNRNWNEPMDQCDFKVFTGVDNKIEFQIRDLDRRPIGQPGGTLQVVIADRYTKAVLSRTNLTAVNQIRGIYQLLLTKSMVVDWPIANLTYSVVLLGSDNTTTLLFMDHNQRGRGFIEVLPSILDTPSIHDGNDYDFPVLAANIVNTFRIRLDLDEGGSLSGSVFTMQIRTARSPSAQLVAELTQANGGLNLIYDDGQPYLDLRFGPLTSIVADTVLFYEIRVAKGSEQTILLQGSMPMEAGVVA